MVPVLNSSSYIITFFLGLYRGEWVLCSDVDISVHHEYSIITIPIFYIWLCWSTSTRVYSCCDEWAGLWLYVVSRREVKCKMCFNNILFDIRLTLHSMTLRCSEYKMHNKELIVFASSCSKIPHVHCTSVSCYLLENISIVNFFCQK